FAHAGDADDCGHDSGGFSKGNTCAAGGGSGEEKKYRIAHEDFDLTTREGRRALSDFHDELASKNIGNFDDEQKQAFNDYAHAFYQETNSILRHGEGDWGEEANENVKRIVPPLEAALSKSKIGENLVLYRGVGNISKFDSKFDTRNPDSFIGSQLTDNGFISTTLDKDTAIRSFSKKPDAAIFEIDADADTEGTSAGGLGRPGEREVLLNRGH